MLTTVVSVLVGIPALLALVGWIGLKVKPSDFPAYPEQTPSLSSVPVPDNLPAPVARHLRTVSGGDAVPLTESAVLSGPAHLRFSGLMFHGRARFVEAGGQGYRHYFELTLFGRRLLRANEIVSDGTARFELPFGMVDEGPVTDQSANISMWAEQVIWLPSVLITDPRLHWDPIDDSTARLHVPFKDEEDEFLVRFDPETGLLESMEAMRPKDKGGEKVLWTIRFAAWGEFHGLLIPVKLTVAWADEGSPWATFEFNDVVYNVDVQEYIRAKGL
jgi:hypothetical protein